MLYRLTALQTLVISLVLLQPHTAAAQQEAAAPDDALYQVELLIFRYLDQSRSTPEVPRQQQQDLTRDLDEELERLQATQPADPEQAVPPTPDTLPARESFASLPDSATMQLQAVAERLQRLDAYDVIAHVAWTQNAANPAQAEALDLGSLGVPTDRVSGSVKLFQRRYLHLGLDLRLDSPTNPGANMAGLLSTASARPAITESRRIRLERLNYFDQPQFGVLAVVKATQQTGQ